MKTRIKARWYVWIFFYCLATSLHLLFKGGPIAEPVHLALSFYVVFSSLLIPLFAIGILLQVAKETTNWIDRTFLILVAADMTLRLPTTFYQLGYFAHYVPLQICHWIFFVATVLLGYRMDQVLKDQDKRIETIPCSTPS
jgi:hypothetical protein